MLTGEEEKLEAAADLKLMASEVQEEGPKLVDSGCWEEVGDEANALDSAEPPDLGIGLEVGMGAEGFTVEGKVELGLDWLTGGK